MEFQEILTILIYGPSIFFFVMKTHVSLDQPLTLEYGRGDEVINKYESSTTTRQALVQTLASVDATMKPTGITTHDPLVFIIGTHTDKLGSELQDKEERLKAKEEAPSPCNQIMITSLLLLIPLHCSYRLSMQW